MYQKILVPVDGSSTSKRGLEEAIRLAALTQGRLRLLHVVDELSFALAMDAYSGQAGEWQELMRSEGARVLAAAHATALAAGVEAETVLRENFSNSVHEWVTTEAIDWGADVIVLGTHGRRGVGRLVLGSSAEHVVRYSSVPVLLVRSNEAAAQAKAAALPARAKLPAAALAFE